MLQNKSLAVTTGPWHDEEIEPSRSAARRRHHVIATLDRYDARPLEEEPTRIFASYAVGCVEAMLKIQRLQMAIEDLETQHHQFLSSADEFDSEAEFECEGDLQRLYSMHQHTEKILLDLLSFFDIEVVSTTHPSGSRHRFHEALLETFCKVENPLRDILGVRDAQKLLKAWKRLRNQVAGHKRGREYDYSLKDDFLETMWGIKKVIKSLKGAVLRAGKIAQRGDLVMRFL